MRIVSPFKDYYDIGMGLGYDNSLDYIRTEKEVFLERISSKEESLEDRATRKLLRDLPLVPTYFNTLSARTRVIGFCGKFYPVAIFPGEVHCYSIEEADGCMKGYAARGDRNSLSKMFDRFRKYENIDVFIANKSPIVFLMDSQRKDGNWISVVRWNARLRDYQFYKVMDPYTAYQAIEMFFGNLASPEKPIPPRTDKEKIESHGMDNKLSFRKPKV